MTFFSRRFWRPAALAAPLLFLAVGVLLAVVLVAGLFLRELGPAILAWAASL